jgi:predicted CXXCH cytochrome family protein
MNLRGPSLALCLFLLALVHAMAQVPTSVRVSDASCAKCHAEIYNKYLATPMANASGAAGEKPHPPNTVRTRAGASYSITNHANEGSANVLNVRGNGESRSMSLDYFLGSGHLGTTYIYGADGFLFESPIAWYAASGNFDMKPGLAEMTRSVPALPLQSGCLRCHMSEVRRSDPGTLNHYSSSAFLHTGVTCEACHGDSTGHVSSGGKIKVVDPARLADGKRDSICINCHLEGDVLVERAGRSALDFAPGKSITDFVSYYVYGGKDATARAVSEVEQFAQSGCKRASGEKMSCTSCHDPHITPSKDERVSFYRSKCLRCHSAGNFAESHHSENKDCTSCHMKQTGAENIPHVAWTDHRILRVPQVARPQGAPATKELAAIFPGSGTKRDLAMAYYKAMLAGDKSLEPVAWAQLNGVRNDMAGDSEALDALGVMTAARGEEQAAADLFRKVLLINGDDLTALSNLGTIMAKAHNLEEAQRLLNMAFARNQDISGLASNLARVDCMAGNSEAAKKVLREALLYNPGLESLQSLNAQLAHCPATNLR